MRQGHAAGESSSPLLDRVGIRLDSFGDSDGKIDDLFEPVTL